MTDEEVKNYLENLAAEQEVGECSTCPRCGGKMRSNIVENSFSRHIDVAICSSCGEDEAMRDFAKVAPLPLQEWDCAKTK